MNLWCYAIMSTENISTAFVSLKKFALLCTALLIFTSATFAQEPPCISRGGELKVVFPELARRLKIFGIVRLELRLTPSGGVRDSKVLGGNPLLASAAQEAVKQAKFEGADSCIITFEFKQ